MSMDQNPGTDSPQEITQYALPLVNEKGEPLTENLVNDLNPPRQMELQLPLEVEDSIVQGKLEA